MSMEQMGQMGLDKCLWTTCRVTRLLEARPLALLTWDLVDSMETCAGPSSPVNNDKGMAADTPV